MSAPGARCINNIRGQRQCWHQPSPVVLYKSPVMAQRFLRDRLPLARHMRKAPMDTKQWRHVSLTIHDVLFDQLRADTLIAAQVGTRWKNGNGKPKQRDRRWGRRGCIFVVRRVSYAHISMQRIPLHWIVCIRNSFHPELFWMNYNGGLKTETYTHTYTQKHTHTHTYTQKHTHTHTHTQTHTQAHAHTCKQTHTHMFLHIITHARDKTHMLQALKII